MWIPTRKSLFYQLIGAFLLVIAIGAVIISLLTAQATRSAFLIYTTRSGQLWAQRLAPQMLDYYTRTGSWKGVDAFLQSSAATITGGENAPLGQGRGSGAGQQPRGGWLMAGLGQRIILADEQGNVIADTKNEITGKRLSANELKNGEPLQVNGSPIGTIIVIPGDLAANVNPSEEFLSNVNRAIASSAVIATLIAFLLGALLFLQITSPLQQLKNAARAIASGELSKRVPIRSQDEFGELSRAFNQMAESLENAESQRKQLIADVAHELRTPLAAIQGTLEGLQDGVLPLDDEQINALHAETMLLNRLIDDLRLISLAEAGQLKLEKQTIDLEEFIRQAVERMRGQANQKKVSLELLIDPDLPPVSGDSDRLTQVLHNLISNSLRYTPEGGRIAVQVRQQFQLPGEVVISVTDTGSGIDSQDLPHIFNRFYRSDKSRARLSGGSGLGLAIVRQLVEAHGGRIWAESPVFLEEGCKPYGTRIVFTIPKPDVPGRQAG